MEDASTIDFAMEAASGPHFSGLRLEGLLSSPSASPRAAAAASNSLPDSGASVRQPFVIGNRGFPCNSTDILNW